MHLRGSTAPHLVAVLLMLAAGCAQGDPATGGGRGLVLITVDGLLPEHVAAWGGSEATPNLDAWIGEAHAWPRARSASTQSVPSVATYLTGLAPDRHGVRSDLDTPLGEEVPTLAESLSEAGFSTAAFPDSSFFRASSGLVRGFDVVAHPPGLPITSDRWIPLTRPSAEVVDDFGTWLDRLGTGEDYFAWVHFSTPGVAALFRQETEADLLRAKGKGKRKAKLRATLDDSAARLPAALQQLDAAVGRIRDALAARGGERQVLVLAGSYGDSTGGEVYPPGPGFSVHDAAVEIPVIASLPGGRTIGTEREVWSPDVPATLAHAAAVELPAGSEGVPLEEPAPGDRVAYSFAWAGRDQLGIAPSRVAWSEGESYTEGPGRSADEAADARLRAALAARAAPPRPAVPLELIGPWLESKGLELRPTPENGRPLDPETARGMTRRLWQARRHLRLSQPQRARGAYEEIVGEDPLSLSGGIENGQLLALSNFQEKAREQLNTVLEHYPQEPEALHWYAHALWSDALPDAAMLIEMILPHKLNDADVLYDLACTKSLEGYFEESAEYLRRSIVAGYRRFDHIETDADLRELRQTELFSQVMQEFGR